MKITVASPFETNPAVDVLKGHVVPAERAKKRDKEVAHLERALAADRSALSILGARVAIILMMANFVLWWLLSTVYAGIPLLRLPFTPFRMFSAMSHRGLSGDDMHDANVIFVFALCNVIAKPIVAKAMNVVPTAGGSAGMMGLFSQAMSTATGAQR